MIWYVPFGKSRFANIFPNRSFYFGHCRSSLFMGIRFECHGA